MILTNPFNRAVHFRALRAVVLNFALRYPNTAESQQLILMLNLNKYKTNDNNQNNAQNQDQSNPQKGRLA